MEVLWFIFFITAGAGIIKQWLESSSLGAPIGAPEDHRPGLEYVRVTMFIIDADSELILGVLELALSWMQNFGIAFFVITSNPGDIYYILTGLFMIISQIFLLHALI